MRQNCFIVALFAVMAGTCPAAAGEPVPFAPSFPAFAQSSQAGRLPSHVLAFDAFDTRPRYDFRTSQQSYNLGVWGHQVASIPWELAGVAAALTAIGVNDWSWGDTRFHFHSEGWFGKNTSSGGMDKLGHAFSTYVLTDFLTWRIRESAANPVGAEFTAATLAFAFFAGIEVFDGITAEYGFSWEDIVANGAGAAFSVVRNLVPGMREKIDFRMMFTPESWERPGAGKITGLHVLPPYRRQRFNLALKLSGFEAFRETPLRFVELHGGYYARGFHKIEQNLGYPRERHLYVGLGLNLNELLFGPNLPNLSAGRDTIPGRAARTVFEYIQVPYTSINSR